jgi:thioredoxin 1
MKRSPRQAARSGIPVVDEAHFQAEVLRSRQPVLVAFSAGWSEFCQTLEPVLEEVARATAGQLEVFKVDVDDDFGLSVWYEIQSVPTLLCFLDGKIRLRILGTADKTAILSRLKPLLPSH